jgi:hypothetical protein
MITPATLEAFASALYEVRIEGRWLDALHGQAPQPAALPLAILTAANPGARLLDEAENRLRNQSLQRRVEAAGWRNWPARGRSPDSSWVEDSLLIEAPLVAIDELARAFGQLAVWLRRPAAVRPSLRLYALAPADFDARSIPRFVCEWVGSPAMSSSMPSA